MSRWLLWGLLIFNPRLAWKEILDRQPFNDYMFWLLIALSGLIGILAGMLTPASGAEDTSILRLPLYLTLGPFMLSGLIYAAAVLFGALGRWLGKWLGGDGTYQQMQAVLIWSGVPFLLLLGCWVAGIWVGGQPVQDLYVLDEGDHVLGYMMLPWMGFVVGLGYAEAHKFSIWKGLLVSGVTYVMPTLLIYVLF